jgi:hypothetical protein
MNLLLAALMTLYCFVVLLALWWLADTLHLRFNRIEELIRRQNDNLLAGLDARLLRLSLDKTRQQ